MVMGMANLAMVTGNIGRDGVGVNPLRGQNNVQGSCDMGSFPHELPGYRHVVPRRRPRRSTRTLWGETLDPSRACGSPTCSTPRSTGTFRGLFVQGEDIAQSDPNTQHVEAALRGDGPASSCRTCSSTRRREFAHVFLPGHLVPREGRHLHQRRAAHQPGPPGACRRARARTSGRSPARSPTRHGLPDALRRRARDHGRDRRHDARPSPACRSPARRRGQRCSGRATSKAPHGTPTMHVGEFVRGKGKLVETVYVPTTERPTRRFPLILTTGRILTPVQRRRPDPAHRRTTPGTPRTCSRSTRRRRGARHQRRRPGRRSSSRVGDDDAARRGLRADAGRAWSTRPSTTRSPAPTSSPPRTPTGRRTARSTR